MPMNSRVTVGESRKELSALEPLEHSVPAGASDSKHIRGRIAMGPLEHSVPDLALLRTVDPFPERTASDSLDHSGLPGKEVEGRRSVSLELLEHLVMGAPQDQWDVSSSDDDLRVDSKSVVSDDRGVVVAIVVGAVGSAFPWFLTGWAHEVEVEFMIDTGCQVTILATTIFERMCTMDLRVCSRLRPCRRRLVSADSSHLTVKGELNLNVVFPGLCCDMLLVVANIGSDGLLGTEALQLCLSYQLDLRRGSCGRPAGRRAASG